MPLQNRVAPWGEIVARPERGAMMGNRGGRIHDDDRRLGRRRWASRQWICCVTSFKGWQREVMGRLYTELFFLDEATALAAGHRPCFECRRAAARAFAQAWARGHALAAPPRAPEMDRVLHAQRLGPPEMVRAAELPDFAMFGAPGAAFLKRGDSARRWDWSGLAAPEPLPTGPVPALTPAATRAALAAGYVPEGG